MDRAKSAKDGFTGHMEEVDEDFRIAWTTNCMRRGQQLNWGARETGSWSAEGGSYWFEGLVKLAWQLDDQELKWLVRRRLEPLLSNMNENAIGFLWWLDRRKTENVEEAFGPGDWQFWVFGMAERVVAAYFRASGDPRAKRVLEQAFDYAEMGRRKGGMAPLASGIAEAARLTGSAEVSKTLEQCYGKLTNSPFARPPYPWLADTLNLRRYHECKDLKFPSRHGVWASEALMSVLSLYESTGERRYRDAVISWYDFFDRYCQQPYGVTMMDEEWGWAGASRGTETCDVAAEMATRTHLLACLGDGRWADDVELAFFNAGPGCISRDFRRHVYYQLPNRLSAPEEGDAFSCAYHELTRFKTSHWPLCCTAALNRILPNYVESMWMKTSDGGVAAALYGPCSFTADLASGRIVFEERTDYPFDETVVLDVKEAPGTVFPLKVRVPRWCVAAEIAVNGEPTDGAEASSARHGFVSLNRAWKPGDRVALRFPMEPRVRVWRDMNDFGRERRSLYLGPLLFALAVPERDDNTPACDVKEPVLSSAFDVKDVSVIRRPLPHPWNWAVADAPVRLTLADADGAPLELVPYGCTKLRLSALAIEAEENPVIRLENKFGRAEVDLNGARVTVRAPVDGNVQLFWPWFDRPCETNRPMRGFARNQRWRVAERSASRLVLTLGSTRGTVIRLWPHAFRLRYEIVLGERLTLRLTTENVDSEPMDLSMGFHPAFAASPLNDVKTSGFGEKAVRLQPGERYELMSTVEVGECSR